MAKWKILVLVMLLGLMASVVSAQNNSGALPPLAGHYSVMQSFDNQSMGGDVTFTGTGPVYWASYKGADGTVGGPTPTLMQSDVVTVPSGEHCAPASLIRQSDGTLFGEWLDRSVGQSSVGFEYLRPTAPTTNFIGTYLLVGSTANGGQYKGTVDITRNSGGIYSLTYNYAADPSVPNSTASSLTDIGIVNGNVLGFGFNEVEDKPCSVLVLKLAADGSFAGEFTASNTALGKAEGKLKP